jgi:hypothetical protein
MIAPLVLQLGPTSQNRRNLHLCIFDSPKKERKIPRPENGQIEYGVIPILADAMLRRRPWINQGLQLKCPDCRADYQRQPLTPIIYTSYLVSTFVYWLYAMNRALSYQILSFQHNKSF